jgi:hypothetical protein
LFSPGFSSLISIFGSDDKYIKSSQRHVNTTASLWYSKPLNTVRSRIPNEV